jgi:hypothetical protein
MKEFILGRSPISVISVEKPLAGSQTSAGIRPLTREESFDGRRAFSDFKPQKTSENSHDGKFLYGRDYVSPKSHFLFSDISCAFFCLHLLWQKVHKSVEIQTQVMKINFLACNVTITLLSSQIQDGSHGCLQSL